MQGSAPQWLLLLLLCSCAGKAQAQLIQAKDSTRINALLPKPRKADKSYIAEFERELTTRVFGSRKFTNFALTDKSFSDNVRYRPNSPFNLGLGINYRIIGLNLGFNLPVINRTTENGKTRFLDLQTHVYGRKLVLDFYGQLYKGYYLPNTSILVDNTAKYLRPDIGTLNVGLVGQYIFNGDKFSFRAAYLQNEVQKKSAGSMMVGATVNTMHIGADSTVIPYRVKYQGFFNDQHFDRSSIVSATANIGYGYTFVLQQHFFVTGSLLAGLGLNYTSLRDRKQDQVLQGMGNEYNATVRFAFGYHSRRYFAGLHYVGTVASSGSPVTNARQISSYGNFRISVARRWTLKKKLLGFY